MRSTGSDAYRHCMDEIYRMLGREHEADLEREAERRRLATGVPRRKQLGFARMTALRLRFDAIAPRLSLRFRA
jgi:hypothetical protein